MSRAIDLLGKKIGKLTVMERMDNGIDLKHGKKFARWLCQCECGVFETKRAVNLKAGVGTRCKECWKIEKSIEVKARMAVKYGK